MMLRLRVFASKLRCIPSNITLYNALPTRGLSVDVKDVKDVKYVVAPSLSESLKKSHVEIEIANFSDKLKSLDEASKVLGKHSPLEQMKLYQDENKHTEVLNFLNFMKKKNISLIDLDIIAMAVSSASASKQPHAIVSLIDFAQAQGIIIDSELALAYIKACKECASDSQPGMWSKAVGMLETTLATAKSNGRVQTSRKVKPSDTIAQCFEESLVLCANSGKWRNVLDIIEKTTASHCPLTERMLSAAIVCCAREVNGIATAYNLFRYMMRENITRSTKVYSALLQGFVKAGLLDKYEVVWAQMKVENMPCTDTLYATRIDAYAALGDTEKAEATLTESLISIKRPKQSYNALYLALLKSGNIQKALDLVKKMREVGVQPPEQHNASFHLTSLSKIGLVGEGLKFLRQQEEEHYSFSLSVSEAVSLGEAGSADTSDATPTLILEDMGCVTDAAWQSLFKGCLTHGSFEIALEVLDFAVENQVRRKKELNDSFPSASTVDTTLWLSQLFRAVGKADNWEVALKVADKYKLSHFDQSTLLRVLSQGMQVDEAIRYHKKSLDALCDSSSSSRLEKYVRTVTHGFIQQLASDDYGDRAIEVFDDLHTALAKYSSSHSVSPQTPSKPSNQSKQATLTHLDKIKTSLPMMYTSAIRYTVGNLRSLQGAQRIMDHQALHGVTPMWSCTRYAMKVMSEDSAWELLLDVFAGRAQTSDYLPGDELAYTRALRGCCVLGRWQDSLSILADLLTEMDTPGPGAFELTLEVLASQNQWEMMTVVVKMLKDRQVHPTTRMIALCTHQVPATLREQLLKLIGEVKPAEGGKEGGGKQGGRTNQRSQKQKKLRKIKKSKDSSEDSSALLDAQEPSREHSREHSQEQQQQEPEKKKKTVKLGL